jgi:hypothetical protein
MAWVEEEKDSRAGEAGASLAPLGKETTLHRAPSAAPAGDPNGSKKSLRDLLAQSDQNDWRTPRKYLEAARAEWG